MAILRRDDLKNVRMSEPPCFLFLFSLRAPRRGLPVARRLPLIVSKPQPLAELLSQRDGRAAILRLRIRKRSQPQVLWAESVAEEEEAAAEGARAGTRAAREAATGRSMQSEEDIGTDSHGAALSTTPATKRRALLSTGVARAGAFRGWRAATASATGCGGATFSRSIRGVWWAFSAVLAALSGPLLTTLSRLGLFC